MRKITITSILILVLAGLGAWVVLAKPFSPEVRKVEMLSDKWMEDLQFKDFRSSGLYHHKLDRGRVDIGRALERLFLVKPEMLDIIDYRLVKTELDSSGRRARVKVQTRYKKLNYDKEPQEGSLMLYWMKRHPDCPIGGTCPSGTCVNEFDGPIKKTKKDDQSRKDRKAPEPVAQKDETYDCDPSADRDWFMNLDSTLKEKPYQRD